jgi:hypothetical protein
MGLCDWFKFPLEYTFVSYFYIPLLHAPFLVLVPLEKGIQGDLIFCFTGDDLPGRLYKSRFSTHKKKRPLNRTLFSFLMIS